VGMLKENLGWLAGARRIRDPPQYIVQAASGERSGVEERLDDLRRLSGIEAGSGVVPVPTARHGRGSVASRWSGLGPDLPGTPFVLSSSLMEAFLRHRGQPR